MKKIGIVINTKRPHANDVLSKLRELATKYEFKLFSEDASIAELLNATHLPISSFAERIDLALALGGDGTVLYTARKLHGLDIPIMGINLGRLGFLTSVSDSDMEIALNAIATDCYKISERDVAECRIYQNERLIDASSSLNDIVLGWGVSSRIVTLKLSVNSELVGAFMCDGMIVSTPTGSTGHSLSAGGPILHPNVSGFEINVICPHTLSSRPLVVPNSSLIEIEIEEGGKELILSVDGRDELKLEQGNRIEISRSPHTVKFLQLQDHSYFSVLSKKLHWRGSSL